MFDTEEMNRQSAEADARPSEKDAEAQPNLRLQLMSGVILDLGGRSSVSIGRRDPQNEPPDLDLGPHGGAEHGVSRQHAIIRWQDEAYTIEDLKAINNTLLNGFRLFPGQQYPLKDGDQVEFGTLVVKVLL